MICSVLAGARFDEECQLRKWCMELLTYVYCNCTHFNPTKFYADAIAEVLIACKYSTFFYGHTWNALSGCPPKRTVKNQDDDDDDAVDLYLGELESIVREAEARKVNVCASWSCLERIAGFFTEMQRVCRSTKEVCSECELQCAHGMCGSCDKGRDCFHHIDRPQSNAVP
jgi:hypothetical protein